MAQNYWTSNGSGSWYTAADWSSGEVPAPTDDVVIAVAGITVTIDPNAIAAQVHSLNTVGSTIDIDGGTLFTIENAIFNGGFIESSGIFMMSGYGASFHDGMNFSGGTIDDYSGAVQLLDGGSLGGTITGNGALDVVSGNAYINAGFSATIASIVVGAGGGKLGLNANFSYAKNFTLLGGGALDLFGHTMKLTGTTLLEGTIGNGQLTDSSTMTLSTLYGPCTLDNGLTLSVAGIAQQNGNVAVGAIDSGAKINVAKTGSYEINGNWNILNPGTVGAITNAGLFAKELGAETSRIDASFSNTGAVAVQIGTLLLNGQVNNLGGTISGNGTLGIAGGQTTLANKVILGVAELDQQSGLLVLNKALSYAGAWDMTGGVLNLNTRAAKLDLTGQANLDGGTLTSFGGSLTIAGTAQLANFMIGGPTTITIDGAVDQTGNINFGLASNPVANIVSGGSWSIEGDSSIIGSFGVINNAGLFTDPNGSGDAVVQAEINNSGTITVNHSTLTLAGTNTLAGALTGSGLLDLTGTTVLEKGLAIKVAQFSVDNATTYLTTNQSFGNTFIETGSYAVLDLGGNVLSLNGPVTLDYGQLTDGGTLAAAGTSVIGSYNVVGGATLAIGGSAEQTNQLNLANNSSAGTLDITAQGKYTLDDDVGINGGGTVLNAGTLTAAGTGTSQIGAVLDDTGTAAALIVNDQVLQLGGGGTLTGSISGIGTLLFSNFGGSITYQLDQGLSITTAGWQVGGAVTASVDANVAFGGQFALENGGTIQFANPDTLTLSGSTLLAGGVVSGAGTLLASSTTTLANTAIVQGTLVGSNRQCRANRQH